jgi:TonB family protein
VALRAFLTSVLLTRSVPVAASVVAHAGLGAGLLLGAGGHARAGTVETTIEIETLPADPAELPAPEPEKEPETRAAGDPVPHSHTHPYPVPASHDARPHDPALRHDDDHGKAHAEEAPAAATPAVAADATLPRFTLAVGGATMQAGTRVAAGATGTGNGSAPASSPVQADVTMTPSTVDVPARLVQSVTAAYPPDARADDVEGDVGVEIVVDSEGRVIDARVARAAGRGFDENALSAIRRYRFSPAQHRGRPVRVRMPWTVQFRLR